MMDATYACAICGAEMDADVAEVVYHLTDDHAKASAAEVGDREVAILASISYRMMIPFVSERDGITLEGLAQCEWRGVAGHRSGWN